jgi:hypothetical protein
MLFERLPLSRGLYGMKVWEAVEEISEQRKD